MLYETERLIVREFKLSDCNDLYEYASNREVTKYLTFATYTDTKQAEMRLLDRQLVYKAFKNHRKKLENANWVGVFGAQSTMRDIDFAIALKSDERKKGDRKDKVIGAIGFSGWDSASRTAEVGYVLNLNYQGQGLMTEALVGFLRYISANNDKLGIKRVIGKHDASNTASGKVMERAGMSFVKQVKGAINNNLHTGAEGVYYEMCFA